MIESPTTPDFPNDNDTISAGTATPPDVFSLDSVPPPPHKYKGQTRGTKDKTPIRPSAKKTMEENLEYQGVCGCSCLPQNA